jgi:hypothetical protein
MGTKRHRGPIKTLHHAVMAESPVRVSCWRCGHYKQMAAYQLWSLRRHKDLPLFTPMTGFRCTTCHGSTIAIVHVPRDFAYGLN